MAAVRAKLGGKNGQQYWRGLEELAETEEFQVWLDDEFPYRRSIPDVDRRSVLKLMGASLALAGLSGCRNLPQEKIIPFVKEPEDRVPGIAEYYATAFPFGGFGFPVLVESHEGRPTKLEGNPDHVASGGASDSFTQAAILNFYDPDRSQDVMNQGLVDTWETFFGAARELLDKQKATGGAGVRFLTGTITSPTFGRMMAKFQKQYPQAAWHQYDIINNDGEMQGTKLAFGQMLQPIYDFSKAKAVLSLDGDFLATTPHKVKYATDFVKTRNLEGSLSRLYAVESTPGLTGAYADHRVTVTPPEVLAVAIAIAAKLGVAAGPATLPKSVSTKWIDTVAEDLRSGGLVYVGEHQPAEVHALAHAINAKVGGPVYYSKRVELNPTLKVESLADLSLDMNAGKVQVLFILGGNPVYGCPGDIKFADGLIKVPHSVYLGDFTNETSKLAKWVLPEATFLEAWGDVKSLDGTITLIQPLIEPLFHGKSQIEFVASLMRDTRDGEAIVRETYGQHDAVVADLSNRKALENAFGPDLSRREDWEKALNDGQIPHGYVPAVPVSANLTETFAPTAKSTDGLWGVFIADPTIYDGSWANNGWMQELPKPLTKLVWDNAVHVSPATADQLGIRSEDLVNVTANGTTVEAVAFIQPGHPDGVVTLPLGYGRTVGGKVLTGTGFDFTKLRTSKNPGFCVVQVEKSKGTYPLSTAQLHHSMEGRDIIREGTLAEYQKNPKLHEEEEAEGEHPTLYNLTAEWAKSGYPQWGMAIDLNTCIGCNACVTACQAENNIPTVGKIEVSRGRELHWIRVDRYYRVHEAKETHDVFTGAAEDWNFESPKQTGQMKTDRDVLDANRVTTVFQPVTCMHCETAPCEPVCPVAATVHSHEGLNQMVYNRCVGTRYCSNNCPYKVRRFNYYNYQFGQKDYGLNKDYGQRNFQGEKDTPMLRLLQNPDVTVRSRGVMEKCTYCVQRINKVRINSKKEDREIRDGEIVTACEQACPTRAITFGNIADPEAVVTKKKGEKRNYTLLEEINTRPRTTYLAKVRNPHPDLENA